MKGDDSLGGRLKWIRLNRLGGIGFRPLERLLAEHGTDASHNSIRRYEKNERVPTVDFVVDLARLADVNEVWALTGEGEPDRPPSVEASQRAVQEIAAIVDRLRAAEIHDDREP